MGILPKELDNPETPLYPIGIVAEMLDVTEQTLRVYEKSRLITPCRRNRDRYYSANDIVWLKCLRRFIKEDGLNLKGIEKLLKLVPCYEVSPCQDCTQCTAYHKRGLPCASSVVPSPTQEPRPPCSRCEVLTHMKVS
jgi:MerR family transcriptional regulator, heat shock protein HspR